MKHITNELRRFVYAPWMPAVLAVAIGFLLFYFGKMYAGQETQNALLFLLSDRRYFGIYYALLALFVFGLDVESGAVDAGLMAGHSAASVVLWKSILYFAAVIVFEAVYSGVCMRFCGIEVYAALQALLQRLILDMGTAALFIPLQFIFRALQPTLIAGTVAAAVFIAAAVPKHEMWFAVMSGGTVPVVILALSVLGLFVLPMAAGIFVNRRRRK